MIEEFFFILSFPVFCVLFLFPNGKYCTPLVNKGRVKKGSCKKHNEFSCPEGCLIKGTCLFSAVEQQLLSLPNTNIAINFNFLHFFGHQRADRIVEEKNKAIRVSKDLNGLWTRQLAQFAWMTESHACGSFLFLLRSY